MSEHERIERESEAVPEGIGDLMAEAALPGIFASGKTVVGSESGLRGDDMYITFRFDDGSEMTIMGTYEVNASPQVGTPPPNHVEEGRQLMSGNFDPEQEQRKLLGELES